MLGCERMRTEILTSDTPRPLRLPSAVTTLCIEVGSHSHLCGRCYAHTWAFQHHHNKQTYNFTSIGAGARLQYASTCA